MIIINNILKNILTDKLSIKDRYSNKKMLVLFYSFLKYKILCKYKKVTTMDIRSFCRLNNIYYMRIYKSRFF